MRDPISSDATDMKNALARALDDVRLDDGTVPRDEAVSLFRRHIGRHHGEIRRLFEGRQLKGVAAATVLAALMDGVIACLADLACIVTQAPNGAVCVC
ncbi:hypothetical protein, partial [Kozakia baliensis]